MFGIGRTSLVITVKSGEVTVVLLEIFEANQEVKVTYLYGRVPSANQPAAAALIHTPAASASGSSMQQVRGGVQREECQYKCVRQIMSPSDS